MKHYSKAEWACIPADRKNRWTNCSYYRSLADRGQLPPQYIGRRTLTVNGTFGADILTEGVHFVVDDEEGRSLISALQEEKRGHD